MNLINNIIKNIFTDKLSIKERYYVEEIGKFRFNKDNVSIYHKILFNLDDNNYSLYVIDIYCKRFTVYYYKNGKFHRNDDKFGIPQPAVIYSSSDVAYWNDGKFIKN